MLGMGIYFEWSKCITYKVNVSSRRHNRVSSLMAKIFLLFSSVILLTFSVIVTTRQYVGNPIDCIHTKDVPDDVFDLYCWIHSTYTIPRQEHTIEFVSTEHSIEFP